MAKPGAFVVHKHDASTLHGFTECTRHGRLRHPRFLGLRFDKPARQVIRER